MNNLWNNGKPPIVSLLEQLNTLVLRLERVALQQRMAREQALMTARRALVKTNGR